MKRCAVAAVLAIAVSVAGFAPAAHATTYTKVVRYGPFTIPAADPRGNLESLLVGIRIGMGVPRFQPLFRESRCLVKLVRWHR